MRARLLFVAGIALLIAGSLGLSSGTTAQDTTDERIAQLESIVAELTAQVADLEARVEALEGAGNDAGAAAEPATAGSGDIALSGTGDTATELISLQGAHTLAATCTDGFIFTIDGVNVDNPGEIVVIPLVGQLPFEGSTVVTFDGGRYAFSIACTGDWTLDITWLG